MTAWIVFAAVGLGSFAMRVIPLVARTDRALPPRLERAVNAAGLAAIVSLVVTSTAATGRGPTPMPVAIGAVAVGLALAKRGHSMLRVVGVGLAVVLSATLAGMVLLRIGWSS